MIRNIALSLVTFSISLAALCLALLAISIPNNNFIIEIPWSMRLLLSAAGSLLLISAAFATDWVIDSFVDSDWDELDKIAESLREKKFNRKYNYFFARLKLFGGGYVLLSIAFGLLIFIMLSIVNFHLEIKNELPHLGSVLSAILCGVAILIKLLTRRIGKIIWTLFFVCGLAAISLMLNILTWTAP